MVFLEVVYMLKKGGRKPFRPNLEPLTTDINPALVKTQFLIKLF